MRYNGLAIIGFDVYGGYLKKHHLEKIKSWGFDSVLYTMYWHDIEKSEHSPGDYDEYNLSMFDEGVKNAKEAGLKVVLSTRVCFWPGGGEWPEHNYVNLTDEGRRRYARFLQMIIQRFPECDYCLWHFPYHAQTIGDYERNVFKNTTYPFLLAAAREHTNNTIIYAPIHQGDIHRDNGEYYDLDENSEWYMENGPLTDSNIIYSVGHMVPNTVSNRGNWNHDVARMDAAFAGIRRFRGMDKEMCSVEYCPLHWDLGQDIHPSRIDCLRESFKRMKENNVSSFFWRASAVHKNDDNFIQDMSSWTPTPEIFEIIAPGENGNGNGNGNGEEEFPWGWIALTAGIIAIIYLIQK